MQTLQKQAREQAKAVPQPPAPQAPAPQPDLAKMAPQTQLPSLPTPAAPKPSTATTEAPLPAAPKPTIADNSRSPGEALRDAMRGAATGANIPSAPVGGSAGPLQAGAQILSDTQGVDFNAYMRRLRADLYRNWIPLMPAEVEPPIRKRGIVGIRF